MKRYRIKYIVQESEDGELWHDIKEYKTEEKAWSYIWHMQ